jgi:predicted Zn-dependent protease
VEALSKASRAAQWCRTGAQAIVILTAAITFGNGCAVNPVTGKRQFMLLSEADERSLGEQSDEAIVTQYGLVDDPELAAYVDGVGKAMVPVSHRPGLPFEFRLLDDPVVNAFALPGGFVYVTRGILAYLDSEAALAGVIGHEIGHVTARHGAERYTKQALFGLGIGLASEISAGFAKYAGLAGSATQLLLLKYGRDDERQSDRLGVEYATHVGYDTNDMAEFFRTLGGLSEGSGRLPSWASTHPDPGERYETVRALTGEWKTRVAATSFRTNREAYLRRLEDLPFGPNPREGFVRDGKFLHPELAFEFPVPAQWKVMNGKREVQVAHPEGSAAVIFAFAQEQSGLQAAANVFTSSAGIQEQSRERLRIGGFAALRIRSIVETSDGPLTVESTFIRKGGKIFVLSRTAFEPFAIAPPSPFNPPSCTS